MNQQPAEPEDAHQAGRPSHVVGIGASAGGLDAIERFFDNLPSDTGMAFVIVQHLSPDFKSLMDELLARHTSLPILHVEDAMEVRANHVYLIPKKKEMIISAGRLLLSERDRQQDLALPIDIFFRSLAQDCGRRAIAIVLSGGGSDGSRGIRAVHEAGGLVLVQSAESAQFDGMPRAAREAGVAAHLLAPDEMPKVVMEHAAAGDSPAPAPLGDELVSLGTVHTMLQEEFGIDFTHYKPSTVTRRIERRLQLARVGDMKEYVSRLKSSRQELDVLYRDLLIGVTRFFRNEEAFEVLEQRVLPELLQKSPPDEPFRVWVAGCATGEEAYSLAIVLHELTSRLGERPIKIFASDVHRGSLEIAAAGVYPAQGMGNVSPERLERYFTQRGDSYQVVPELRQMVVFAAHNVIRDAPFTRMNLVSCRNMLIYLQPPAQQKVLTLFHFALARGGVVFLGPSETPGALMQDFEPLDRRWRIYKKYSDVRMPVAARLQPVRSLEGRLAFAASHGPVTGRPPLNQLLGTYDVLLDKFMPPSLLVNDRDELVHAFGGASRFLKARDGRQGLQVMDVVEGELKMVLVAGVKRALKEPSAVVFRGLRAGPDQALHDITIEGVRGRTGGPHALISFQPSETPLAPASPREVELGKETRAQLGVLEAELTHTRENLQSAIEELETSNEELQAANEELLASNEELQSTNEELQSVNEELYTVNAEYQRKITELTELTNDVDNLLAATEIGTVFLDPELKIRKFTPRIAESFNLVLHDIGRPIEIFTHDLEHPGLVEDARRVLATGERVEREVRDRRGRAFFLRILPYRARGGIRGVLVTLIDVSGLKAAEDALFHERYLLNSLLASTPDAIYFKDARGKFIRANEALATRLGFHDDLAGIVGKTALDLPNQEAALALHREDESVLQSGKPQHYKLERRETAEIEAWDLATRMPLLGADEGIVGIMGILRDVTQQVQADEKVQEAVRRRDQFLAMLSHELRNPLAAIVTAVSLLQSVQDGAGRRKFVDIVGRQSKQMARLLDDLLDVSRVTQNKIELKRVVVDLRGIVREAADAMRSLFTSRSLAFQLEVDEGPLPVDGDPTRLQQIVVNLLHNAAKYTQRGGHVELVARREGESVVIRVRDDGAGIAPEMLESIFELFVQSTRTLDRAQGGIGVGLTLVRALVAMHGGAVAASSAGLGKGTSLEVKLPSSDAPIADEPAEERRSPTGLQAGDSIVVVEDNEDAREVLCDVLRQMGLVCHTAADGNEGLALIRQHRPTAALIDIGLPGIDGLELARRVRQDPSVSRTFLVALTGYGRDADRSTSRGAGFDAHLVKPTEPETLGRLLLRRAP